MKKLIAILMAALMLTMLFAGCAKDENKDNENDKPVEDTNNPAEENKPAEDPKPQEPAAPQLTKEEKQEKINAMIEKMMEVESLTPARMALDESLVSDIYGLTTAEFDAFAVHMPMMNVHATEFAIFWAAEGQMDAIKAKIEARQDAMEAQWSTYLPEQYELVQNYKLIQNGDLICYLVSFETDANAQIIADLMGEGSVITSGNK